MRAAERAARSARRWSVAALLLVGACDASVSGEVAGVEVPALDSGFWMRVPAAEQDAIAIYAADLDQACDRFTSWWEGEAEAYDDLSISIADGDYADAADDYADRVEALYRESFPEQVWLLQVGLLADPGRSEEVAGAFDVEAGEASVTIVHQEAWPDADAIAGGLAGLGSAHTAERGTVEIERFDAEGELVGSGDAVLRGEDGGASGAIELRFSVSRCTDAERVRRAL